MGWLTGASSCLASGGTGSPPIDESLISVTLHLDASAPTGGNGSQSSPFNTLQAALNRAIYTHNAANQGVRVLVAPGTYREGAAGVANAISFPTPVSPAPVVVEGAGWSPGRHTGDVVFSGSEIWSGWTNEGDGTWTREWPYAWGVGPNNTGGGAPPEAMLRYECVHVNGMTYYQMLGPSDPNITHLTPQEGAFWVNEEADVITIRPPAGFGDLNTATVEVTTKRRLMHHWRLQASTSPTHIALRNLVFQHAAPGLNSGAVYLQNVNGLVVEDCVFRDNKQMGISVVGMNAVFTVRRTDIIRNGEMGSGFQGLNILAEDVKWNDNSRFADVVMYYGWGYGGIKIGATSNLTFRRIEASRNYGMGLWFDTANVNCLVEDSVVTDNTSQGVWSENNNRNNITALNGTPTVTLRRTYIAGNYRRSPQATALGGGYYITESENSLIEHSVIYDNAIQFRVSDGPGRGPIANTTVRSSVLASRQGEVQRIYATGYGTTGWQQFFDTLSSATGNNDYYYSGSTDGVTSLSPQPQPDSTLAFYTRDQQLTQNLAQWKSLHAARGADQDSRWITTYAGQPLVHAEAVAAYRQENGGTVDGFRVRRVSRDLDAPLTVNFTSGGTATAGVHYEPLPSPVIIPAGAREVLVPFTPIQIGENYGEHSVTMVIAADAAYVAPDPVAGFILEDALSAGLPRVSVTASTPTASEDGPNAGVFTLARTGSGEQALTVGYTLGGTASAARYQVPSGQVTFPAGAATIDVPLLPVDDAIPQLTETAVLTVLTGTGYVPSAQLPISATVSIRDNDITAPVQLAVAPGAEAFSVPVTIQNPAAVAQTFTVTLPAYLSDPYRWSDSTQFDGPAYQWIDIHAIPGRTEITEVRSNDDYTSQYANGQSGTVGGIPLGFSFPYFSRSYSETWLNTNGVLDFGARGQTGGRWNNRPLPVTDNYFSTNPASAHLLLFWDDLRFIETSPASRAFYARPDAETFVMTIENWRHFSNNNLRITAQVVLKSSGEIIVNYQNVSIPYNLGSTIGLQGTAGDGHPHVQVSYNSDYVQSEMALRFRPVVSWLSASANTFQVVVPAGSYASFDLFIDPADLPLGTEHATLQLSSNHPDQPDIALPVTLVVSAETPPNAPAALSAAPFTQDAIALSWTDVAANEAGFRIERASAPGGPWTLITTLEAGSEFHTDPGLAPATTYHYRVIAFNDFGDSTPALASATTWAASDVPPAFTDASLLDITASEPLAHLVSIDQELRAFFDEAPVDSYPGTAGAGWLDPWTIRATTIDTSASAALLATAPMRLSGPCVQLSATSTGVGKRAFLTRSYGDAPTRRIDRTAPHRIVFEIRPDDISGFATTADRLYLWDRPAASNADHNNADMTWSFITSGSLREWRYHAGTIPTSTGVRLVEDHVYQFNIEVDPAERRWRFNLRDLDWQTGDPGIASHASAWVAFRNTATGASAVGGNLHAGAYLDSLQTLRLSLDSVRITAADLSFTAGALPAGLTFDPGIGRIEGTLTAGEGAATIGVVNPFGTTWRDYTYDLPGNYETWASGYQWPEPVETSSAPEFDSDGDGIPNLLEYALNGDPLTPATEPPLQYDISDPEFQISFFRARVDLNYLVEASSNLVAWTVIATNPGQVGQQVNVSENMAGHDQRFLRLRLTVP